MSSLRPCCESAADAKARTFYPDGDSELNKRVTARMSDAISTWRYNYPGVHWFDNVYIRYADPNARGSKGSWDPGNQINGMRRHFTCPEGHKETVIILSSRMEEFTFLVEMISTRFVVVDLGDQGGPIVVPRWGADWKKHWPTKKALAELVAALEVFFGIRDRSPFAPIQVSSNIGPHWQLAGAKSLPSWALTRSVESAQLFTLLHEVSHLRLKEQTAGIRWANVPVPPDRRAAWSEELGCDTEAFEIHLKHAASVLESAFPLTPAETVSGGLMFAFLGADAALHSMEVLESLEHGRIETSEAVKVDTFVRHPPARYRRNVMARLAFDVLELYIKNHPPIAEFRASLQESVTSTIDVRDALFSGLGRAREKIPESLRNVRWVTYND